METSTGGSSVQERLKKEACNCRPVSLTCIACQILESLVRDAIMNYLKDNNMLTNRQYGFVGSTNVEGDGYLD